MTLLIVRDNLNKTFPLVNYVRTPSSFSIRKSCSFHLIEVDYLLYILYILYMQKKKEKNCM